MKQFLIIILILAAGILCAADYGDHQVFQRSGSVGSIPVAGTTSSGDISVQVLHYGTDTVVVDSVLLISGHPGGAFLDTLVVPQGGWYKMVVFAGGSSDTSVNKWGVGDNFVIHPSQSNGIGGGTLRGDSTDTANDLCGQYYVALYDNNGTWRRLQDPQRDGCGASFAISFANEYVDYYGLPVGIISPGIGGSPMTDPEAVPEYYQWHFRYPPEPTDPASFYGHALGSALNAGGVRGSIAYQGENDAGRSVSQSDYYAAFSEYIGWWRGDVENSAHPFFIVPLATDTSGTITDTAWHTIQRAHLQLTNDSANVFIASSAYDLPVGPDGVHLVAAAQDTLGKRIFKTVASYIDGTISSKPYPRIISVDKVDTNTIRLNLTRNIRPWTADTVTSFEVLKSSTPMTVTGTTGGTDYITVDVSQNVNNNIYVRNAYGVDPDISSIATDSSGFPLLFSDWIRSDTSIAAWFDGDSSQLFAFSAAGRGNVKASRDSGNWPTIGGRHQNADIANCSDTTGYIYSDTSFFRTRDIAERPQISTNVPYSWSATSEWSCFIKMRYEAGTVGIINNIYRTTSVNVNAMVLYNRAIIVYYYNNVGSDYWWSVANVLPATDADISISVVKKGTNIDVYLKVDDGDVTNLSADYDIPFSGSSNPGTITLGSIEGIQKSEIKLYAAGFANFAPNLSQIEQWCNADRFLGLYGYADVDTMEYMDALIIANIDSISQVSGKRGTLLKAYLSNQPDSSATSVFKLGTTSLPLSKFSGGEAWAYVPSTIAKGIYQVIAGDTEIGLDTASSTFQVLVPANTNKTFGASIGIGLH